MRLTSFTTPTLFKSDIIMMIFPTNSALRNFSQTQRFVHVTTPIIL